MSSCIFSIKGALAFFKELLEFYLLELLKIQREFINQNSKKDETILITIFNKIIKGLPFVHHL